MSNDESRRSVWRDLLGRRGESGANAGRRRLIALGAVAVALLLFVALPGYIASRSAFLQRYAHMDAAYGTWADSAHAKVACRKCHVSPGPVAQLAYSAKMLSEFYVSIVDRDRRPTLFGTPTNEACSSCHMDLRTISPKGDLNIPHRAHVSALGLDCIRCHDYVVHKKTAAGKHTPPMSTCLKCHDGRTAKNQCSACHTDKDEPPTHRAADWLVVHGQKAVDGACNRCHEWTEGWCADCHSKRPRSHAADWRSTHRDRVEKRRNCEACHEGPFCARCHGEVPKRNFDPGLKAVR